MFPPNKVAMVSKLSFAIPPSNYTQSIRDGWFVISSTCEPAKKGKTIQALRPLEGVREKVTRYQRVFVNFHRDKIQPFAIPPSNYSQSIRDGWFVISFTHAPAKNAKLFKP